MGPTSLEGSAVSSSSSFLVEKLYPGIAEVLLPLAWKFHGSTKLPQLLHSLPLAFAGADTHEASKRNEVAFFYICAYEAKASISQNQEGF